MTDRYQLVMKKGPGPGQVFTIEKDEVLIGRDIQCDISVIEASLSRKHARLFERDGEFFLEDLGSTNGTFIGETRISDPQPVPTGVDINLGGNLVFVLELARADTAETAIFSGDVLKSVVPEGDASKVFISYSRRNQPFVEQLHAGLTRSGINTWVDWEGIPLTADWWREIEDAIEGADGFVFVISPDSLASEVCGRELQAAIQRQKRLIPVLHVDPGKGAEIPDQISSHNWVFMQDESQLKENLKSLVESINTDLGWVQRHTRILVRASEWERQAKNPSFLLQGDDLVNAESWLENAGTNHPKPTQLHIEYIQASRRAANRRQRTVVTASLVALGVTMVLAVIAFSLYLSANAARADALDQKSTAEAAEGEALNQAATAESAQIHAENQAATAEAARILAQNQEATAVSAQGRAESAEADAVRQAEKARAGEVAATGLSLVETNPPLAGLLALEALRIAPDNPTAERVLGELPNHYPPLVRALSDPEQWLVAAAWSDDGVLVTASGGEGNLLILWDLETLSPALFLEGHETTPSALAWSDDGRLASADFSGSIIVWDLDTGEPDIVFPAIQDGVQDLAWSLRGVLASASSDGTIALWEETANEPVILDYEAPVTTVDWSLFGQLASGSSDGNVAIWNVATGLLDQIYADHQSGVLSVDWGPDGSLASGSQDSTVVVRNPSGNFRARLQGHTDYVNEVDWSRDGRLASASWDGTVILWNLDSGEPLQVLRGHIGSVDMLDWGPGGELSSGSSEFLFFWDMDREPAMTVLSGHLDWNSEAIWTPDGFLVSGSLDGSAIVWDMENRSQLDSFFYDGCGLAISQNGFLVVGSTLVDAEFGDEYFLAGCQFVPSPDGSQIAALAFDNSLAVWDLDVLLESGEVVSETLYISEEGILAFDWSPDGVRIAVGLENGDVEVLEAEGGRWIKTLSGHQGPVLEVSWGDPNALLTASEDQSLIVWDPQALEIRQELLDLGGLVEDVDWGPDGLLALAVSGEENGRILIWDLALGEARAQVLTPFQSPFSVSWSPDGSRLAFAGSSYNIYVMDTYYAEPPCTWLARNLTEWEWEIYFPGEPYQQTCP